MAVEEKTNNTSLPSSTRLLPSTHVAFEILRFACLGFILLRRVTLTCDMTQGVT